MKLKVKIEQEVEISTVHIEVAVRYEEEDIPNDFPLRKDDLWIADVDIDTGRIKDWPIGKSGRLSMKVCDEGTYTLLDKTGKIIATRAQDYVPNDLIPGEYGDYIDLKIDAQGFITNWPKKPNLSEFFPED